MADRVYCPDPADGGRLVVLGDEARHLARVRRATIGQVVEAFDGRGHAWRAEVRTLGKDRVELALLGGPAPERLAACRLTLATAVPKGERFDWLVEKATELGVARLVPLVSARSVVDPRASKLDRLRRLVVEACKQSGRDRLMELAEPISWADFLDKGAGAGRFLAHPGGEDWPRTGLDREATLAIGPEGGFADEEVAMARAAGWRVVGLGATLLRIETAGVAGSAVILALAGGAGAR